MAPLWEKNIEYTEATLTVGQLWASGQDVNRMFEPPSTANYSEASTGQVSHHPQGKGKSAESHSRQVSKEDQSDRTGPTEAASRRDLVRCWVRDELGASDKFQ